MEIKDLKIIRERCSNCGDCISICPQSGKGVPRPVFSLKGGSVIVSSKESCIACFSCVEFCMCSAIHLEVSRRQEDFEIFPSRNLSKII